jgi:hypothetical protein
VGRIGNPSYNGNAQWRGAGKGRPAAERPATLGVGIADAERRATVRAQTEEEYV